MCDFHSVDIQNFDTQTKRERLDSATISEEETATPTPRSASHSYNDSAVETPRSRGKSVDSMPYEDEDEDDDEDDSYDPEESDYYAFLRELAGSFEAGEDSEGESGSEDEAEVEEDQPSGDSGTAAPSACGPARRGGVAANRGEQEKHEDVGASAARGGTGSSSRPCPPITGTGSADSSAPSAAPGGLPCQNDTHRRNWCPTPSRDNRPPVEDDYDVIQATRDYALQRPGDRAQQLREDLREAIRMKRVQAQALLRPAGKPHSGPDIRAHYARVRSELLAQVHALESELASLDQACAVELTGCAGESFKASGSRDLMASAAVQEQLLGSQC